jgi:hypothetical protein
MSKLRQHWAIVAAFVLPIAVIGVVALTTYVPGFFLSTNYNFLYAVCTEPADYHYSYTCTNYLSERFVIEGDTFVVRSINPMRDSDQDSVPDAQEGYGARIFLHDTSRNESREISIEEAQQLRFSSLRTSPDGVTVSPRQYRGGGDILFFDVGGSSYEYYLTKGNRRKRLNVFGYGDRYYYHENMYFMGWITPERP